jgi:hypothetical protein
MDEIWQRHKTFIVQCAAGGFVFLIALLVKSNMYSGADDPEDMQRINKGIKAELQTLRDAGDAPNRSSIDAQVAKADEAMRQIRDLAGKVASVEQGEAYVRENIKAVLEVIKQPEDLDRFFGLYQQLRQAALTSLRSDAGSALVGRAAELGKELDETLGLSASYENDEIPTAIHGLAIVADIVDRCLEHDGIDSVPEIHVYAQSRGRRGRRAKDEVTFVKSFQVRVTIEGLPEDVMSVLRSFNRLDNRAARMTVIESVDVITRKRADADEVKCTVTVLGLQHLGLVEEEEGEEGEQ